MFSLNSAYGKALIVFKKVRELGVACIRETVDDKMLELIMLQLV